MIRSVINYSKEVKMRKMIKSGAFFCLAFILLSASMSFSQEGAFSQKITFKPGLGGEYSSRTISWDDGKYTSKLRSTLFIFSVEFELMEGFSITPLIGYSLSTFDALVFRKLPLSVELDVGKRGGLLFGGELKKSLFSSNSFEIDARGQFVYYLGAEKQWDISGLSVNGTVTGKPTWMRAWFGPAIAYTGYESFSPYLFLGFNKLWGSFKVDQSIQTLTGTEEKKIKGESLLSATIGAVFELTESFSIQGEAQVLPYKKSVDYGFTLRAVYSF